MPYGPILVVEDVPNIRDLLEATLSFKGYPVITAANGQLAMERMSEERPALIISDVLMPVMDGFSLAQNIRSHPSFRDIPLILISATYVAHEDREFALRLGAVRFLEKPVDTDEFLLIVAELLTEGAPSLPEPLSNLDFFNGYRERLSNKLTEKNHQIKRTRNLLRKLAPEQKPAFEKILQDEIQHRDTIQRELESVQDRLKGSE